MEALADKSWIRICWSNEHVQESYFSEKLTIHFKQQISFITKVNATLWITLIQNLNTILQGNTNIYMILLNMKVFKLNLNSCLGTTVVFSSIQDSVRNKLRNLCND